MGVYTALFGLDKLQILSLGFFFFLFENIIA